MNDLTVQWLIERGQPEGDTETTWHKLDGGDRWITDASSASMFPTKETCEAYIAERGFEARAVEHAFGFGG